MGLFDIFTGDPGKDAAAKNAALYQQLQTTGTGALNTGLAQSTGAVNTGATGATNAITSALPQAQNALTGGYNTATGDLTNARADYAPLAQLGQTYGGATNMLLNSLNVNGAAGTQAAQNAFQASPGFNFQLGTGLDAINRAAAARGMPTGGNVDRASQDYGMGVAQQQYGDWQSKLAQFLNPQLQATQGAAAGTAAADTGLAGLATNYGLNNANLLTGAGSAIAGIDTGQGSALANLYGQNALNTVNLNTAVTGGQTKSNTDAAAAQTAGSGNLWNFGLNAAKLAVSAAAGVPMPSSGGGGDLTQSAAANRGYYGEGPFSGG